MKRLLALVVVLVALASSSAVAQGGGVGLSIDGKTFSRHLDQALFASTYRWVPGDVDEATFYVRNDGESAARMTIDVIGKEPNALMSTGRLDISAQVADGPVQAVTGADPHRLVSGVPVAADGVVPVRVRVSFAEEARNGTQLLASDLDFRVDLSGDATSTGPAAETDDFLPDTGAGVAALAAVLAAILLGGCATLMSPRSARGRDQEEGALHG